MKFYRIKFWCTIIIILVLAFLIVNLFEFTNELTILNLCQLKNIYLFNGILTNKGFSLFISLITIFSFISVLWKWHRDKQEQMIADINGFCEEIRHNINLTANLLKNKSNFYTVVYHELLKMKKNKTLKYPTPFDLRPSSFEYKMLANTIELSPIIINRRINLIKLRNDFMTSAISSKTIFSLKLNRLFLNIGHLNFSIMRYNLFVDDFNNNKRNINDIQNEYFNLVHFRLYFALIDLIYSFNLKDFIDEDYIKEIKKKIDRSYTYKYQSGNALRPRYEKWKNQKSIFSKINSQTNNTIYEVDDSNHGSNAYGSPKDI